MDWCYEHVDQLLVEKTLEKLNYDVTGFSNLTTRFCQKTFNPQTHDRPNVYYFSYGASPSTLNRLSLLKIPYHIVKERVGVLSS